MHELTLDRTYRRGDRGAPVRIIQEWLTLHGFAVVVDGVFGPASDDAVRRFQARHRLATDGVVGKRTTRRSWRRWPPPSPLSTPAAARSAGWWSRTPSST